MDDIQQAADLSLRGAIWTTDEVDYEVLIPGEKFAYVGIDSASTYSNGVPRQYAMAPAPP